MARYSASIVMNSPELTPVKVTADSVMVDGFNWSLKKPIACIRDAHIICRPNHLLRKKCVWFAAKLDVMLCLHLYSAKTWHRYKLVMREWRVYRARMCSLLGDALEHKILR